MFDGLLHSFFKWILNFEVNLSIAITGDMYIFYIYGIWKKNTYFLELSFGRANSNRRVENSGNEAVNIWKYNSGINDAKITRIMNLSTIIVLFSTYEYIMQQLSYWNHHEMARRHLVITKLPRNKVNLEEACQWKKIK